MTKEGEINYLKAIGEQNVKHAANKPFSDIKCHSLLAEIAAVMALLPPPPARLLDIGCGTGWTSIFFAKRGYDVVGVDIAPDMVALANDKLAQEQIANAEFKVFDYENMPFTNEFDCVVFYDSLHHAVDEKAALTCAHKALKLGGVCVTAEPGVGHAQAEGSLRAVEKFNVTEKDMPPFLVMSIAQTLGFGEFKVFPHGLVILDYVYGYAKGIDMCEIESIFANLTSSGILRMEKQDNNVTTCKVQNTKIMGFKDLLEKGKKYFNKDFKHCNLSEEDSIALQLRNTQRQLVEVELDRAARLDQIHTLTKQLKETQAKLVESEADRAARLEVINDLLARFNRK
jgi:SAM-dependent methyltransferase